jgi:sarcosine oxidase
MIATMDRIFDTIVLGLGAMGSATVYQLAKRGNRVLGLDRFSPPHARGSTHGESRITRQAIGEGEHYTPLSLRSYELWRQIERETGEDLLTITGGLVISGKGRRGTCHVEHFFDNTIAAAQRFGIRHEILDASEIRRRFPQFHVSGDEVGYYEHEAGVLRPEACVTAQLRLAERHGAEIHRNETVEAFVGRNETVRIVTSSAQYEAARLVICAGPWLTTLLEEEYTSLFKVYRQVMVWFDIGASSDRYRPGTFPVFIWEVQDSEQGIYGFPAMNGPSGGIKIATEQYEYTTTPDSIEGCVEDEARSLFERLVRPRFPDLTGRVVNAASCLYTVTADSGFVIDEHPKHASILVVSPCSGHGFKHSAAIGEALAQLIVDGRSALSLDHFTMARLVRKWRT